MYIKSLTLENFQKHSHLKLDFSSKLNVLYGDSDVGKSCIIRAIKWVFFNEGRDKDIRKEGTKKTSVKVILDNDTTVEKIKSNTINAYILNKKGQEEKRFDSVGKTIPKEIQDALQVRTIEVDNENVILNIADQISLPFLIGKSATFRSKLFNKLTGSDIIDKVFQSLNKDMLKISREVKLESEHLKDQEVKLEEVTVQKNKIKTLHDNFKKQYEKIKTIQDQYVKLESYSNQLNDINNNLKETKEKLGKIKEIPNDLIIGLNQNIESLDKYKKFIDEVKKLDGDLDTVNQRLESIKIPDINIDKLKNEYSKLEKLKNLYFQLLEINKNVEISNSKIDQYQTLIIESEKKYKEILKTIKICPFYKKPCPLNKNKL